MWKHFKAFVASPIRRFILIEATLFALLAIISALSGFPFAFGSIILGVIILFIHSRDGYIPTTDFGTSSNALARNEIQQSVENAQRRINPPQVGLLPLAGLSLLAVGFLMVVFNLI